MSRLAAVEKGEYYPTPKSVVQHIAGALDVPAQGEREGDGKRVIRLLDPCCGEGLALAALAEAVQARTKLPVVTWGVEISPARAREATGRLDQVFEAPFEAITWSPIRQSPASVLFLNPPYDHNGEGGRMELDFLQRATPALAPGGTLVLIIPTSAVAHDLVNHLFRYYDRATLRVYRFGDAPGPAGFDAFRQLVILATRRKEELKWLDQDAANAVWHFVRGYNHNHLRYQEGAMGAFKDRVPTVETLGELTAIERYTAPAVRRDIKLRRERWLEEEIEDLAVAAWPKAMEEVARVTLTDTKGKLPQPLIELRDGHVAQIVAAGLAGVIALAGRVFKGCAIKSKRVAPHPEDEHKEIETEFYETHIVTVSAEGLKHLSAADEVAQFLQEHIRTFKTYISKHFVPYGNTSTPAEEHVLDTLSRDKTLPGMDKPGLLPFQRKVAVALTRSLRRYGVGHLVAEMGFGKTRTAMAVAELTGAYPLLITCPPHLVDKWVREAESSVPGVKAHVVEGIGDFEAHRRKCRPGQKLVLVMSRSTIKLGAGWKPAPVSARWLPEPRALKNARLVDDARYALQHAHETVDPLQRYQQVEAALTQLAANHGDATRVAFSSAYWRYELARRELVESARQADVDVDPAALQQARERVARLRREALEKARPGAVCPECGQRLEAGQYDGKKPGYCYHPVWQWDAAEEAMVSRPCGAALYQFGGRFERWPLADYVRRKAPRFFKLFVADEVHQFKAKDSDQGWAFRLLAGLMPTLTLTGTFFGGPSSSIRLLLYATLRAVRHDYGFHDEKRWVDDLGVLETTYTTGDDEAFGAYNAKRRERSSTKERPGISPGIVRYTLPTTVFASMKDLGVALPPFSEEFVVLEPTPQMDKDLKRVWDFTWDQMKQYWPHYTSAWLQWNLARPNSCFRNEVIEGYARNEILEREAVIQTEDELLPKEEWLVNKVRTELAEGRRVVVYARQTGTRDIRGRLVEILKRNGVGSVAVLNPSVHPRKREAWLEQNPCRVLITNPKLVETGLDLVQYSTAVFFEVEYSLYTLIQACRRVWRLGQTRPVRAYYLAYAGTLEEKAYALMGLKVKAQQLLYGEEIASALVEDVGDASLVMALIKAIQEGKDKGLTLNRHSYLLGSDPAELVASTPLGSLVRPTAQIASFAAWLQARGLTYDEALQQARPKAKARRKASVPAPAGQGQLQMPF